jgi:small subunit ribosomal protein S15
LPKRIRNVLGHLTRHKKDLANRPSLRKMEHQLAKILKYLKRTGHAHHDALLPRLALDPAAAE